MSSAPSSQLQSPDPAQIDQRVILHGVSWDHFEAFLAMRGEDPTIRIAYCEGELEIMAPSNPHERRKTRIAALLEAWLMENDVVFDGAGSWTIRSATVLRGVEPDECYVFGRSADGAQTPDLAIEVEWTSGGLDKLDIYRGLGVREVWIFAAGRIDVHVLEADRYELRPQSAVLPTLNLSLLARFVDARPQSEAVREYLAALRAS